MSERNGVDVNRLVSDLSDDGIKELEIAIFIEKDKREERHHEKNNECPDCVEGYVGSEGDEWECRRCKGSGKYAHKEKSYDYLFR